MKLKERVGVILSLFVYIFFLSSCTPSPQSQENVSSNAKSDKASLNLEAQIVYESATQPVARAKFYLLDADLLNVTVAEYDSMKDAQSIAKYMQSLSPAQVIKFMLEIDKGVQKKYQKAELKAANKNVNAPTQSFPSDRDKSIKIALLLYNIEKLQRDKESASHFIKSFETDFQGKHMLDDLKPGVYWILGVNKTRADYAVWNRKITLVAGENKILLDQGNAEYCR